MKKNYQTILGAAVILAFVGVGTMFFYRHQPISTTVLPKFKIAFVTWPGYAPLYLAQDKGYFAEEGVKVELTPVEDVAQRKVALQKGDLQALGDTVDSLVLARDEKVPGVGVLQLDVSNGADGILATDDIKTVADLKGKKIAVQKNFVSESLLNYLLQKNGLAPNDVETVDTEAGAAGAAFVAGQVKVAVTYEPWLSKAKERSGGHLLVSSKDAPGVIVDILTVNESYLHDHPEVVQKVMRAWFKALTFWQTNPTEANQLMAAHYNMKTEEFAELVSGLSWPTYQDNVGYFNAVNGQARVYEVADTFADVFLKTGQIKAKPNMTAALNGAFLITLYGKK